MLIPVILSGGAGSRLWPVSREAYPKPFIRLADNESLLEKTLERALGIDGADTCITVTNREYYFLTKDEYAKTQSRAEHTFLLEPCGRNTAPAVAMAALHCVARHGGDAQLLVLPADHLIEDLAAFSVAVRNAQQLARDGTLVTFGIAPTQPDTGYGYIELGRSLASPESFKVKRFIEKPPLETAIEFLSKGGFVWNSGMFCFKASAFLTALERCAPGLFSAVKHCWDETDTSGIDKIDFPLELFSKIPDLSIDYAVMEKHDNVAVVQARFDWNDIGSWSALAELTAADVHGNRVVGEAIMVGAEDCYVQSDSRMVAAVGVKNLLVIDTPDALLVTDKSRVQDVKQVVSQLKLSNHATHQLHRTVHRPWGTYTVLEEGPQYKIKRIVVKAKATLSLQMHRHRSEHWVVIEGDAEVVNGDQELTVHPNESTFIPAGNKHRLANPGSEDLVIIEVQTGSYVGEDDIVRLEDVYGRA